MADRDDIWAQVVSEQPELALIALTNPDNAGASSINATRGLEAADAVLDLWEPFVQAPFDAANPTHLRAAARAVLAHLWELGGATTDIAEVKWGSIYGRDGLLRQLRNTGPRARQGPSRGTVHTSPSGSGVMGWSNPRNYPGGKLLPSSRREYE